METRGVITFLWAMIASWDRLSSNSKMRITGVSGLVDETLDAVPEYRFSTEMINQTRILQVACIDEDPRASVVDVRSARGWKSVSCRTRCRTFCRT